MNHNELVDQKVSGQMAIILPKILNKIGFSAAEEVFNHFKNTSHPHAKYTFDQESNDRDMSLDNTNAFAKKLARKMAWLVANNEVLKELGDKVGTKIMYQDCSIFYKKAKFAVCGSHTGLAKGHTDNVYGFLTKEKAIEFANNYFKNNKCPVSIFDWKLGDSLFENEFNLISEIN